ncbi:MAG: hypothetical protein JJT96_12420 [Opitutales bacterium]|nr:hypothetical protein [Opitutales bacterium]
MNSLEDRRRAFADSNVRRFIAFRIFFHARYYYPVFTLLFLDFGLTLEQFALLNVVWALTIVIAEVPSGAMADVLGRRRLMILGASLMIGEMALLSFMPIGMPGLTLLFFGLNRILSGLAEAMVSGADEALAYDTLKDLDLEHCWPDVLERATRLTAACMGGVMILGATLYDPSLVNRGLAALGSDFRVPREWAMRLPLILSLVHAFCALAAAWGTREPNAGRVVSAPGTRLREEVGTALGNIRFAAGWTLNHRFVLFVIIAGVALDSVARQYIIVHAEYMRLIDIPVAAFGLVAAGFTLLGMVFATFAKYLVRRFNPVQNLLICSAILLFGLVGVGRGIALWGLLFVPCIYAMFTLVAFLQSHYINREVESRFRATVLSFKGLGLNLALGFASLLYMGLVATLRKQADLPEVDPEALHRSIFFGALNAFPAYYLLLLVFVLLGGKLFIRRKQLCFQRG